MGHPVIEWTVFENASDEHGLLALPPIILVSANLLLHLLEDQGTFSSSWKYLLVRSIYLSKNFQKSMYFK